MSARQTHVAPILTPYSHPTSESKHTWSCFDTPPKCFKQIAYSKRAALGALNKQNRHSRMQLNIANAEYVTKSTPFYATRSVYSHWCNIVLLVKCTNSTTAYRMTYMCWKDTHIYAHSISLFIWCKADALKNKFIERSTDDGFVCNVTYIYLTVYWHANMRAYFKRVSRSPCPASPNGEGQRHTNHIAAWE